MATIALFFLCVGTLWPSVFYGISIDDGVVRKSTLAKRQRNPFNRLYGAGMFSNLKLDHAFTLSLHAIITLMIFYAFGQNLLAFCAASLYAVNPTNNQTSVWLNGRRYALNVICHLSYLIFPALIILYPAAIMFQPSGLLLPLSLMSWHSLIIIPALALAFARLHHWFMSRYHKVPDIELRQIKLKKLIIYVKTIGFYFFNCLIPTNPGMYYDFLYRFGNYEAGNEDAYEINGEFARGILALSLCAVHSYFYTPYMTACWLLTISQWGNIITVTQTVADRYCSLPNVFLMGALAQVCLTFPPLFLAVLPYYAFTMSRVMRQHQSSKHLFDYHIYTNPQGSEAVYHKCTVYMKQKDYHGAIEHLKYALDHNPNDFKLLGVMAICLCNLGEYQQSNYYARLAKENMLIGQDKLYDKLDQVFEANKRTEKVFVS